MLELFGRGNVTVEIALQHLIVCHHDAFHEVVVDFMFTVGHLLGNLTLFCLPGVIDVCLVPEQVGDAVKLGMLADRELDRGDTCAEPVAELGQGAVVRGALLVELVDENHPWYPILLCNPPGVFRLHFNPVDRVNHEHGEIGHTHRGVHVSYEVGVARRVDQVDLVPAPLEGGKCETEGHAASMLFGVEVGDCGALLDGPETFDGTCAVQQGFGKGRFAGTGMSYQGDIADFFGGEHLHYPASRIVIGGSSLQVASLPFFGDSYDRKRSPGGEIGRRCGLKHRCPSGRGGSSPSPGTFESSLG